MRWVQLLQRQQQQARRTRREGPPGHFSQKEPTSKQPSAAAAIWRWCRSVCLVQQAAKTWRSASCRCDVLCCATLRPACIHQHSHFHSHSPPSSHTRTKACCRLLSSVCMLLSQVGPYSLLLRQRPGASGNTAHLTGGGRSTQQVKEHRRHSCTLSGSTDP